jgi:hypothetical protein
VVVPPDAPLPANAVGVAALLSLARPPELEDEGVGVGLIVPPVGVGSVDAPVGAGAGITTVACVVACAGGMPAPGLLALVPTGEGMAGARPVPVGDGLMLGVAGRGGTEILTAFCPPADTGTPGLSGFVVVRLPAAFTCSTDAGFCRCPLA